MSGEGLFDDEVLDNTATMLLELLNLVRHVNSLGDDHPTVHDSARVLYEAIERAAPPVAISFVGAAVLRGKSPLPLETDLYRRSQVLDNALSRCGVQQLRFGAPPSIPVLIELAQEVVRINQGGRAKLPKLSEVSFQKLLVFGDDGARDEATVDAFVCEQSRRGIAETDAVITRDESRWPWRKARAPLMRLERCLSISVPTTVRSFDFIQGATTRGRRVLSAACTVAAVLSRVGAEDINRRAAAHATLVLGCHGFDDRAGTSIEEAAHVGMGALVKSRLGESDPHALRTCALVRAIARSDKGELHPSVVPLIRIAYGLELERAPVGRSFELSRVDLWAWLSEQIAAGRVHAGWGRAVTQTLGLIPVGAHVMADGRLAAVTGAARADAPLRPPVVVNGELKAPETAVQPYSPLAMTPWAK